jgi:hypothetical protein
MTAKDSVITRRAFIAASGLRDGALSSLIGIAARHSIERGSQAIKVQDLVKL